MYTALQKKAIEETYRYIKLANDMYGMDLSQPVISFKLTGRTAGKANYMKNLIKYNAILLEENGDDFLKRTVPHEVAHIVARNKSTYRIKPHGYEWKQVMKDFGLGAKRCHSYDTTNSRAKRSVSKDFKYKCACKVYHLTIIRHRRIQKGAMYTCRTCKGGLELVA
jgi:SprT protein